jgi:hypothetical protein
MKASDAAKLTEEYQKLVTGLAEQGVAVPPNAEHMLGVYHFHLHVFSLGF